MVVREGMLVSNPPRMLPGRSFARSVQLAGWRMAASRHWRVARALSILISAFFTLSILYLALRGQGARVGNVPARAALVLAWTSGLLVASWNATDRASADRSDGILSLAQRHGLSEASLPAARAVAASLRLSALLMLALLPVALASTFAAPDWTLVLARLAALAPLALFAVAAGLVGGAVASACGALSPRHGRSLLTAIVLLPWALDGVVTAGRAGAGSLPGMLSALASLASRMGSGA